MSFGAFVGSKRVNNFSELVAFHVDAGIDIVCQVVVACSSGRGSLKFGSDSFKVNSTPFYDDSKRKLGWSLGRRWLGGYLLWWLAVAPAALVLPLLGRVYLCLASP